MDTNTPIIKVEHVSKSFKLFFDRSYTLKERLIFWKRNRFEIRNVLNDISFTINKGDSVGLIGRNGCGKSTMLKMLTKIYYPNKGKITINGKVSSLIELGAGFHPDMSGRENIYINASVYGLTREDIDKRIDKIIEFSELRDFIDNPIRTYSSGMYMRLAFAVAINVDADILLIDEILAVGDANFQNKCFKKMEELKKDGKTIILVSHNMESVKQMCNKCIWIENGKIKKNLDETKNIINDYLKSTTLEYKTNAINELDNFGNKDAEIVSAQLMSKGNVVNYINTNDPLDIIIRYKAKKIFENMIVGIAIKENDKKTIVYYTNTMLDNKMMKMTEKGCIKLHFDNFILQKGRYYLGISLRDNNHNPLDIRKCYLKFDVYSNINSSGKFILKHRWDLQ